jgi:peroxiredoxin
MPNLEGEDIILSELLEEGPVLIDFWATWCKPCLKGLPGLQELHEAYESKGLTVLAVSVDSPRSRARVGPLIKSKKYTFEVLHDADGRVAKKYNAMVLPRTVLVGPDGGIVYASVGYRPSNHKKIEEALRPLLSQENSEEGEAVES